MEEVVKYTNDLMMAVIVASTAFIGLTTVLCGQVANSGVNRYIKKIIIGLLALSILSGGGALVFAIGWLEVQGDWRILRCQQLFAWQLFLCTGMMILFWFGVFGEIESSKPIARATPTTRPRKYTEPP